MLAGAREGCNDPVKGAAEQLACKADPVDEKADPVRQDQAKVANLVEVSAVKVGPVKVGPVKMLAVDQVEVSQGPKVAVDNAVDQVVAAHARPRRHPVHRALDKPL